jgi:hypothetical protein
VYSRKESVGSPIVGRLRREFLPYRCSIGM